jgi:hypothetical protein
MDMVQRRLIASLVLALVLLAPTLFAQEQEPVAILEYVTDKAQITVLDADGFEYNTYIGMELVPGDTIETDSASAEVRLDPNGTIVKVAPNSEFTVDQIQGRNGASKNSFSTAFGKIRTVAAEVSGAKYEVRTPTAVGGVRGTDFGVIVEPNQQSELFVRDGEVEFTKRDTGESIVLNAGQAADAFAETFAPRDLSAEELESLVEDVQFEELSPDEVAAETDETDETEEQQEEQDQQEEAEDQETAAESDEQTGTAGGGGAVSGQEQQEEEQASETDSEPGPVGQALSKVGEFLGMEIGSVTIGGTTYSKVVLQPVINAGKLRTRLYLPVIYQDNLFNPSDWHRPKGNNEWSFGTDQDWQDEPLTAVSDVFIDLGLKFKYLEYGDRRDPFFAKIGNLESMTIGHGILMRGYRNDVDFPAVRRLGLNTGIDFGKMGFEAMVNDLLEPEIYGTRLYLRPFGESFPLAMGASGVADIDPAGDLPAEDADGNTVYRDTRKADPIFLNVALDLELPIIERDSLALIAFSDIAGMVPYLRGDIPGAENGSSGFKTGLLYDKDDKRLENYGTMTGVFGNLLFLDYRLDFRTYNGMFRPFFYDGSYDRVRGQRAVNTVDYFQDPSAPKFDNSSMGVYGEAGFRILQNALRFEAAYLWPWAFTPGGELTYSNDDRLTLRAELNEGLLPWGLRGSISYERTHFVPTLIGRDEFSDAKLFDENTVLSGEIVYPAAESLDIALGVRTNVQRNEDGTVKYEDGDPVIGPSVTVETRLGF